MDVAIFGLHLSPLEGELCIKISVYMGDMQNLKLKYI